MGKRGAPRHLKRIVAPTTVPVHNKKETTWMVKPFPGAHPSGRCMPLGVLLRDVLNVAKSSREVKAILSGRMVEVDGKVRVEEKFPVGLMDTISIPKSGKHYRIRLDDKGRLVPVEIKKDDAAKKLLKVVKKHTVKKGKTTLTFHDGRNLLSDNHVMVGDSVVVSIPTAELKSHLKREKGARCLVMDGKHAGSIVSLKEIVHRKGGKPDEAIVTQDKEEFVTVAKYLFVVDEEVYA